MKEQCITAISMRESLKCPRLVIKKKKYIHAREKVLNYEYAYLSNVSGITVNITILYIYDELFVRAYLLTCAVVNDAFVWKS